MSLATNHPLSGFWGWGSSKLGGCATRHLCFYHLHGPQVPLSNTKFQSSLFSAPYSLAIGQTFVKHLLCARHLPTNCKRDCTSSPGGCAEPGGCPRRSWLCGFSCGFLTCFPAVCLLLLRIQISGHLPSRPCQGSASWVPPFLAVGLSLPLSSLPGLNLWNRRLQIHGPQPSGIPPKTSVSPGHLLRPVFTALAFLQFWGSTLTPLFGCPLDLKLMESEPATSLPPLYTQCRSQWRNTRPQWAEIRPPGVSLVIQRIKNSRAAYTLTSSISWGHPGLAQEPVPSHNTILTSACPGPIHFSCAEYFVV